MIVDDLDVKGIAVLPTETDPPLVINTDAVLSGAIALELVEPIARWHAEVINRLGGVHGDEFAQHGAVYLGRESPNRFAAEQSFSISIGEALDHCE